MITIDFLTEAEAFLSNGDVIPLDRIMDEVRVGDVIALKDGDFVKVEVSC